MIARIAGTLEALEGSSAIINVGGGLWYDVLLPAFDHEYLTRKVGQAVTLHTIHYLEGDPSHGSQTPRLVGFLYESDRRFFRVFTTVKGIGIRKALRALRKPVGEVASAIVNKDAKFLIALPEIGKRTAETIIAELSGKVDEFATLGGASVPAEELSDAAREAISALVQLGERRPDAEALVERVLAVAPEADTPENILQHAYKLKASGR
jgi:holliday junction DNA helicase RuvA